MADLRKRLASYGHRVQGAGERSRSRTALPRRILHPMDVVEDYAISRGYDSFEPVMPRQSTVGGLSAIELLSDGVRAIWSAPGSRRSFRTSSARAKSCRMRSFRTSSWRKWTMSCPWPIRSFGTAWFRRSERRGRERKGLLSPSHLRSRRSGGAGPKHVMGTRTDLNAAALISHATANFSEMHSTLDVLLYYLGVEYRLEPAEHPLFLAGGAGRWSLRIDAGVHRRAAARSAGTQADHHALRGLRDKPRSAAALVLTLSERQVTTDEHGWPRINNKRPLTAASPSVISSL